MHPTAQMSISFEQLAPTSNQGGLYHLVATQSVSCSSLSYFLRFLAKPKSQIFNSFLSLISKFSNLMSRCMMLRECRQVSPLSSWQMNDRITQGSSPSGDLSSTSSKLFWTYQKTKQTMAFFLNAYFSSTILGCLTILSIFTYLTVVFLTTSSSSVSLNFLMAMIYWLSLHLHFKTTPYAPQPITLKIQYLCIMKQIVSRKGKDDIWNYLKSVGFLAKIVKCPCFACLKQKESSNSQHSY